jgi:GT2 family glycosyltransferase
MNVAVLITCHNRRAHTLRCLKTLYSQQSFNRNDLRLDVWLVDDGSSDGTTLAVASEFPQVHTISGSGNLFWCGGMALAWKHAAASKPDAFLWLNDDVALNADAVASLHRVALQNPDAVVVGSCCDPKSGERTYGGLHRAGAHPGKLAAVDPDPNQPVRCDTFEGNIVWIPSTTFVRTGALDSYQHAMGDIDYGYRVSKLGLPILIAPGFLGRCSSNSRKGTWEDRSVKRSERLKKLRSIKGLPPRDWWRFCRRHGGLRAPFYFVSPLLRVLAGR